MIRFAVSCSDMRVGNLLQESQKIRPHGTAKWCCTLFADAYHVKACKVRSISDCLQGGNFRKYRGSAPADG